MPRGKDIITPAQCRAARALVDMTQKALAELSDVAQPTLVRFENGKLLPGLELLIAIRAALEVEGVIFLNQAEFGPGVRLRERV